MNPAGFPPRTGPARTGASGFTLIEILVTLVILSTGLVVVLEAFQTSLSGLGAARDSLRGQMLARQVIAEIESGERQAQSGTGTFSPPFANYTWVLASEEPSSPGGTGEGVVLVTVAVTRDGSRAAERCSTLMYERTPQ